MNARAHTHKLLFVSARLRRVSGGARAGDSRELEVAVRPRGATDRDQGLARWQGTRCVRSVRSARVRSCARAFRTALYFDHLCLRVSSSVWILLRLR
eukprot:3697141-Pleurochrysis_carterae.AAC.1